MAMQIFGCALHLNYVNNLLFQIFRLFNSINWLWNNNLEILSWNFWAFPQQQFLD